MPRLSCLALVCSLALTQCKQAPTTVLLHVEAASGLPYPDQLLLTVLAPSGIVVPERKLEGAPLLPNEVVLYPREPSGALRILVRARAKDTAVGEGTTSVELRSGEQVRATVVVRPGALADIDGDGVPDAVDNCPTIFNPQQGPCGGPDARIDAALDQTRDVRGDGPRLDGSPDQRPKDGRGLDTRPYDTHSPDTRPPDTRPPDKGCSCPLGCKASGGCRAIVPSNGFKATIYPSLAPITGAATMDTTACQLKHGAVTITGAKQTSSGSTACVVAVSSLTIPSGGSLSITGNTPAVLLVLQQVSIQGQIDAGAHGAVPGPGGGAGGVMVSGGTPMPGAGPGGGKPCACTPTSVGDDCGGGGGGHAVAGGQGGMEGTQCTALALGGAAFGSAALTPLEAGSGGASAGQATAGEIAAAGGAGGGALQISCLGPFTLQGTITAGGGGGRTYTPSGGGGGGGGGSGGGVLLEAVSFGGNGVIGVTGGAGAGGGGDSTDCALPGTPGADGLPGGAAIGGTAGGIACGAGGGGGTGAIALQPGGAAILNEGGGGGGGGAAGRVRMNWYQHTSNDPFTCWGYPTTGEVTVQ